MIGKIIRKVLNEMEEKEGEKLEDALYNVLSNYEIKEKRYETMEVNTGWKRELGIFLARKQMEGRAEETINQYKGCLARMLGYINKPVGKITESDLVLYISMYKKQRCVSNVYLDNIRRVFSSYFGWLYAKGYISVNPCAGIDKIKTEKKIKKPLLDTELEIIRRNCETKRDIALIEFLYSTGVRVSELTALDRNDVNFEKMEVVVYGKGGKEREVYLTPTTRMYLSEYLNSREDEKEALFVSTRKPWERIGKEGVESILKRLGAKSGVEKVHPHRFRRTMATNILNKGMPIEEVKEILGHSKLDTTMIYCEINKENIKHHHKKYMS